MKKHQFSLSQASKKLTALLCAAGLLVMLTACQSGEHALGMSTKSNPGSVLEPMEESVGSEISERTPAAGQNSSVNSEAPPNPGTGPSAPSVPSKTPDGNVSKPTSHPPAVPQKPPAVSQEPEAPVTKPNRIYDIQYFAEVAKSTGTSMGLTLLEHMTPADGSWDMPITLPAPLTDMDADKAKLEYKRNEIRDGCSRIKREGNTAFWVYTEQRPNGSYYLYIGY